LEEVHKGTENMILKLVQALDV